MNIFRKPSIWFNKRTTNQKLVIIGIVVAATGSILIPLLLYFLNSTNSASEFRRNSLIIHQASYSMADIIYNTTIQGVDPRDVQVYLRRLQTHSKLEKLREVDELYTNKEISMELKNVLYMVIDYIDQAIQESTQDINTFRSEGRMDTASSLEKIDSAFAELDMEEVHRLQSEEISKLDADKAVIYANVGTKFYAVLKYDEAEEQYKTALSLFEKAGMNNSPDYAKTLGNLGMLYRVQSKYDLAENLYTKALEIKKNALGIGDASYAITLNNLAVLYYLQGKDNLVEERYKEALSILESTLGHSHPTTIAITNNYNEWLKENKTLQR